MKIAIHHTPGTFSDRWIAYCEEKNIPYKIVNAYDTDIVSQISDCDAFMWHHHHANYKDVLFAKQLLFSLEEKGLKVFPDFKTGWHFDDKVGEKYLLEAIGAPMVKSYVFYSKEDALRWIAGTDFPKVFKLRGGAGASNVKLARNKKEAVRLVQKSFGKGFSQFDRWNYFVERLKKWRQGADTFVGVCKGLGRLVIPTEYGKMHAREKGYAYFQDFIPNNKFDIRVCVVSGKAFALKRMVRKNDFRASGSGVIHFSKEEIDERCVKISFDTAKRLSLQSVGFDFVFTEEGNPLIVEMSYAYSANVYYEGCTGYWTSDMRWHGGKVFDFCGAMVEALLSERDAYNA